MSASSTRGLNRSRNDSDTSRSSRPSSPAMLPQGLARDGNSPGDEGDGMELTKGLATLGTPAAQIALRTALVYLGVLIALRVTGKREIGQFTLFDRVLVLLVANSVQTAMVGADTSLWGGLLSAAVLVSLNWLVGLVAGRVEFV